MGKSRKNLKEKNMECYDNTEQLVENTEEEQKDEYEKQKEYIEETAEIIRERFINYADNCSLPLCEFLDFLNVENYLKWLLEHG